MRGRKRKRDVRVRRAAPDYRRMRSRLVTTAYLILLLGVVSALLAPLATPGAEMTPEYLIGVILERPPLLSVLALVVTAALSTFLVVKAYAVYLYFRTIDALTRMMEAGVPQPAVPQPTPIAAPTPTPSARVMPTRTPPVSRGTTPITPSPMVTPRVTPTQPPTPTVPSRQVTQQVQPTQRAVQPSVPQPQRVQPQPQPTAPVAQPQPRPTPSVSSKKCPYCGRVLPFGDLHTVCPYCGRRLK